MSAWGDDGNGKQVSFIQCRLYERMIRYDITYPDAEDFRLTEGNVRRDNELIDYEEAEELALQHRPKLIMAGASNYSRVLDWDRFRKIADSIGAVLVADMAHYAGLVAAGVYPSEMQACDIVPSNTHMILRCPSGGLIFCKPPFA